MEHECVYLVWMTLNKPSRNHSIFDAMVKQKDDYLVRGGSHARSVDTGVSTQRLSASGAGPTVDTRQQSDVVEWLPVGSISQALQTGSPCDSVEGQ